MARSQRGKLTLADIGAPALILAQPPDQPTFFLGTLIGIASGFLERSSADKTETFEGLTGQFRSVPANPVLDELESGILWIPTAFHNLIADKLRDAKTKDPAATISFAFEVTTVRAKNPAGYSWDLRPLMDDVASNPLDRFIAEAKLLEASGKTQLAIEDRSKAKAKPGSGKTK